VRKKVVHHILLPSSVRNDWPRPLVEAGVALDQIGTFPPARDQPAGFERLTTRARKGDALVHLGSCYAPERHAYDLAMLIEVVERDLSLAVKIQEVLIEIGAVPESNRLEQLQDMVSGQPVRDLVSATEWPRVEAD